MRHLADEFISQVWIFDFLVEGAFLVFQRCFDRPLLHKLSFPLGLVAQRVNCEDASNHSNNTAELGDA
jgi:hypothetical protein